jgi:hypothetical protein
MGCGKTARAGFPDVRSEAKKERRQERWKTDIKSHLGHPLPRIRNGCPPAE